MLVSLYDTGKQNSPEQAVFLGTFHRLSPYLPLSPNEHSHKFLFSPFDASSLPRPQPNIRPRPLELWRYSHHTQIQIAKHVLQFQVR